MNAVGFVVNPIAGMGGRVGLKGTDGKVAEARERGATPRAPDRASTALEELVNRQSDLTLYTAAGEMGERIAADLDLEPQVVYEPAARRQGSSESASNSEPEVPETSATDTRETVRAFLEHDVDLVLFVGGDGTAVDVAEVLTESDRDVPMLGVPAGVKIYSSVFAVTPADAGRIAAEFSRTEQREVNDIDESAYREGTVRSELKAVVPVPVSPEVQSSKQLSSGNVETLAAGFARDVDPETTYVFGPGGTVGRIETELGIDPSPLGVDVWRDGELRVRDGTEDEILAALETPAVIVVSPIGGQGFVFGRGNHQISPAVIRRAESIEIVASDEKLEGIGTLRVDTDDGELDEELRGWTRVRTGRYTTRLVKVV